MNNARDELIEKIRKLSSRADLCSGPEKDAAVSMVIKLMNKYNISDADLSEKETCLEWFKYKNDTENRILQQIIYMTLGNVSVYQGGRSRKIAVYCTVSERLEIEIAFDFYKKAFIKELETFMTAFYHKNRLFPPPDKIDADADSEKTSLSKRDILKIAQMMEGMDEHILNKMIE